jgi:tripartite-type tricarboxylate transporter receptor subunit TctC
LLTGAGLVYAISTRVPAASVAEYIAYAKSNPGKVNEGHSGTPPLQDFWRQQGVNTVKVPYKGGLQIIAAVLAGEVDIYAAAPVDVLPHAKSGKLKLIAYTDQQRHPLLPDVPTLAAATGTDVLYRFWFGLFGPLDMPAALVGRINTSANEALRSAEVQDRIRAVGLDVYPGSPEDMRVAIDRIIKDMEEAVARGYKIR